MIDVEGIAVIGAGLVGCVLAKLLAARGYAVNIFEKREKANSVPSGNGRSTHLIISLRGEKALQKIGVLNEVLQSSIPLVGRMVHELDSSMSVVNYGINNQSIFAIQREALNRILIDACVADPRIRIFNGAQCENIDISTNQVSLNISGVASTLTIKASQIFVCDGASSRFKTQLLNLSGFNFQQSYELYGYKELIISAEAAKGLEPKFMHAWPRGDFSLFAFPNLDGTFTATLIAPLGKGGFESIQSAESAIGLFKQNFKDLNCEELIVEYLDKPVSYLKSSSCSPWAFNSSVLLLGDAAHTMLPFLGQGMNCGFEDCTVFDELLDANDGDMDLTISIFESLRKPNSDCVTEMSSKAFHEFTVQMADKRYLYEKYIENKICECSGGRLNNSYQLLAFSYVPYHDISLQANYLKELTALVIEKIESVQNLVHQSDQEVKKIIMNAIEEFKICA